MYAVHNLIYKIHKWYQFIRFFIRIKGYLSKYKAESSDNGLTQKVSFKEIY